MICMLLAPEITAVDGHCQKAHLNLDIIAFDFNDLQKCSFEVTAISDSLSSVNFKNGSIFWFKSFST